MGGQQYQGSGAHGSHQAADGQGFAQVTGADKGHGHNFLSQLLGLNQDAPIPHGQGVPAGQAHGEPLQAPSASSSWSSAVQSVKLSDALQGITITPPMLFMMLYASFIAWLFVVYWVRHHEPLANGVLGMSPAHASTAAADVRILSRTKVAFPARTCEQMGDIYVPMPPIVSTDSLNPGPSAAYASMPLPSPPLPPTPVPEPHPMPLNEASFLPVAAPYDAAFGQPTTDSVYAPGESEAAGSRLRMIVKR